MESKEAEKEDPEGGNGKGEGEGHGKGQGVVKGAGKGFGYQGQRWTCGRIGHKSAECNIYVVGDVEQQAGVDAGLWVACWRCLRRKGWQRPKKMTHEKAKFMEEYGGPVKISTGCVEECSVKELRRPMQRTLDAWMPRRSGVTVKNKFGELQVGAVDDNEEKDIAAVNDEANDGVVRATVDSGAARSVWPRRKKGVPRRKLDKKPKLAAATGTKIEVQAEAFLEFEENGKQCGIRFLDTDVKKPLAAVS